MSLKTTPESSIIKAEKMILNAKMLGFYTALIRSSYLLPSSVYENLHKAIHEANKILVS